MEIILVLQILYLSITYKKYSIQEATSSHSKNVATYVLYLTSNIWTARENWFFWKEVYFHSVCFNWYYFPSFIMFLYVFFCYSILYIPKVHVKQIDEGMGVRWQNMSWDYQDLWSPQTKQLNLKSPSSLSGNIFVSFN